MKKPEDVGIGTVLADMHNVGGKDWWESLIEGYELTDKVTWSTDTDLAVMFEMLFCDLTASEYGRKETWSYTNKHLVVCQQDRSGSAFKAFFIYDQTTVGVVRLALKGVMD